MYELELAESWPVHEFVKLRKIEVERVHSSQKELLKSLFVIPLLINLFMFLIDPRNTH